MPTAINPKFADQYAAILKVFLARKVGDIYLTQKHVAESTAKVASRVTIRARLEEMAAAGVLVRRDQPVSYRIGNMSALDALTGTKTAAQPVIERKDLTADENAVLIILKMRKARDRRGWTYATMATAVASYWQAKDGLDGLVAKGLVSKSPPLLGNARRFNLVEERASAAPVVEPVQPPFADRVADFLRGSMKPWQQVDRIAKAFGMTNDVVNDAMDDAFNDDPTRFRANNVDPKTSKAYDLPNSKTVRCYALTERVEKSAPKPTSAPVVEPVLIEPDQPYPFLDRVADFLASTDKPWQSADRIGKTFGTDAEMIDNAMSDIRRGKDDRFDWRHTPVPSKRQSVWCYALRSRLPNAPAAPADAPAAPADAPQSVQTPVDAPAVVGAPVEAPTALLTLAEIIEQAVEGAITKAVADVVAQAIALTRRERGAEVAALTVERDKLRDLAEKAQARFAAAESAMLTIRQVVGLGTV